MDIVNSWIEFIKSYERTNRRAETTFGSSNDGNLLCFASRALLVPAVSSTQDDAQDEVGYLLLFRALLFS